MPRLANALIFADGSTQSTAAIGSATSILFGSGAPTAGTGVNGNLYLDYTNLNFWGPKASGAWPGTPFARLMPIGVIKAGNQ